MISGITGKLIEKREQSVILEANGLHYEVMVPVSVLARLDETRDAENNVRLVTYHYFQMTQSSGNPVLIGFNSDVEREFFLQFITVSGIGPRAAIKALDRSISEISQAIEAGDVKYLTTLPGIGTQRAKEIVAKLQGKTGKFGLIQDRQVKVQSRETSAPDWQQEALDVLTQLQYKRQEAGEMIEKALKRNPSISSSETLLNEIYKQKVQR